MKVNKAKVVSGVLFGIGIVGIFVSEVMAGRDSCKAKQVLEKKIEPLEGTELLQDVDLEQYVPVVVNKPKYACAVVKETWKCFIPTAAATTVTVGCLVASKVLDAKALIAISGVATSATAMIGKYRNKIKDYANEDILHQIDNEVAHEIQQANPKPITTSHLVTTSKETLDDDGVYTFYDPFTNVEFTTTKLAAMGAKYFLNRNFSIGGGASLYMYYMFLGLELPEEYRYAGWDISDMADSGYCWIDIDYIWDEDHNRYNILYDFEPGDNEYSYSSYPMGDPVNYAPKGGDDVVDVGV